MSRTSTGMTNTMMWLTVSERRTWRDCGCEIVLTRCRLIDKRSHSREGTCCTTMWRPNLGWSLKISPILALDSNLTAMVERCPCEKTRSPRLSSGIMNSWLLSCQVVGGNVYPQGCPYLPNKEVLDIGATKNAVLAPLMHHCLQVINVVVDR